MHLDAVDRNLFLSFLTAATTCHGLYARSITNKSNKARQLEQTNNKKRNEWGMHM
jgi:hypothetical protein